MRIINAKFNSKCSETGCSVFKGERMVYDFKNKKSYSIGSNKAVEFINGLIDAKEKPLHKQLNGWDGHGRRGEAIYDQIFEREKQEQEKYDPSDRYGIYEGVD